VGFFDKILAKLGFGGTAENPTTIPTSGTTPTTSSTPPTASSAPKRVAVVDVVAQLEQRAEA
jgi:hypothetical protein